jgi:hypothetical protein
MAIEKTVTLDVQSIDGDASRGGWQATCAFVNDQEEAEFGRNVELYVLQEGGGVWQNGYKMLLDGSMIPQRVTWSRGASDTSLMVTTSDYFLSNAGLQGIFFADVASPDAGNPHQATSWNLGQIVKHIVEEHTNISTTTPGGWVDTSGIDVVNSTSIEVYTVQPSNSIWQTIADIAANEFYVRYFTKTDRLIYEPHPQFRSVPRPVTVSLNSTHLVTEPSISFRNEIKTDQVQLYALTDSGAILTSFYPLHVGTEGRRERLATIRCNSQGRLNLLAQRMYFFLNREIDASVTLVGAWAAFLELYDRIAITYTGTTRNGVTVSWTSKKFYISNIRTSKVGDFNYTTELQLTEERLS